MNCEIIRSIVLRNYAKLEFKSVKIVKIIKLWE